VGVSFLTLLILATILSPVAGSNSVNIFPAGSKPYGLTYADHIENFWRWSLHIPANENPINDTAGVECAIGQNNTNSSVFYLTFNNGGKSQRSCEVPAGKGLFLPVMQVEHSDKEDKGATVDALHAGAKKDQDNVNSLNLKIGDKQYKYEDLYKYRIHTEVFDVVFPNNGIFGVKEGGSSKAVADGFYIITEPLTKGNYTIHYSSSLICPEPDPDCNFAQDITYNIIAK